MNNSHNNHSSNVIPYLHFVRHELAFSWRILHKKGIFGRRVTFWNSICGLWFILFAINWFTCTWVFCLFLISLWWSVRLSGLIFLKICFPLVSGAMTIYSYNSCILMCYTISYSDVYLDMYVHYIVAVKMIQLHTCILWKQITTSYFCFIHAFTYSDGHGLNCAKVWFGCGVLALFANCI